MPKLYLIPFQQKMDSKIKKISYSSTLFSEIPSPSHHPPQVKPNAQPGKSPEEGGAAHLRFGALCRDLSCTWPADFRVAGQISAV